MGTPPPYAVNGLSKARQTRPYFIIAILAVVTEIEGMAGRGGGEELVPFFRPHLALDISDNGGISWDRHLPMPLMAFPKRDTIVNIFLAQSPQLLQRSSGWAGAGARTIFSTPLGGSSFF